LATGGGRGLEAEILKSAASQGLWAMLFVALLFYVLKNNKEREDKLLSALEKLGCQYEVLARDMHEIKEDVKDLKGVVK